MNAANVSCLTIIMAPVICMWKGVGLQGQIVRWVAASVTIVITYKTEQIKN